MSLDDEVQTMINQTVGSLRDQAGQTAALVDGLTDRVEQVEKAADPDNRFARLEQRLQRIEDAVLTTDRPVEPPPAGDTPPEDKPTPKVWELIPSDEIEYEMTARDPRTIGYGRDRSLQIVAGGAVFNEAADCILTPRVMAKAREMAGGDDAKFARLIAGYGLKMNEDHEVHSFPMFDGETMVWGVGEVDGQLAFMGASQWTGEGYTSYSESGGLDLDLVRGSGANHPTFHDGSRFQVSGKQNHKIGRDPKRVRVAMRFKTQPWHWHRGWSTGPIETHADWRLPAGSTSGGYSSPMSFQIRLGKLWAFSRNSLDRPLVFGSDRTPNDSSMLAEIDLAPLDSPNPWNSFIVDYAIDPHHGGNVFQVFRVNELTGELSLVAHYNDPYGYAFTDEAINYRSYPMFCQMYPWHRWQPDELANMTEGGSRRSWPWNWDPEIPASDPQAGIWNEIRRMHYTFTIQVGADMPIERVRDHCMAEIEATRL